MTSKGSLRAELLTRRRALTLEQRAEASAALVAWLLPHVRAAAQFAAYEPRSDEPDTSALLIERPEVLLPEVLADGDLAWTARGDRLGVEAIASCDLVLVPALAVDQRGVRLGRGGGSYDRALRRTSAFTIALLYDGEHLAMLPSEPHDVAVDAVVTPSGGLQRVRRQ